MLRASYDGGPGCLGQAFRKCAALRTMAGSLETQIVLRFAQCADAGWHKRVGGMRCTMLGIGGGLGLRDSSLPANGPNFPDLRLDTGAGVARQPPPELLVF